MRFPFALFRPRSRGLLFSAAHGLAALGLLVLVASVQAAPAQVDADYAPLPGKPPAVADMIALGRALFFDPSLSASGRMACATCHSPQRAYGPPADLARQLGVATGTSAGTRAAPSLRYLQSVPPFTEHFYDNDGNDSEDAGPTGGRTWDGRVDSAHAQARLPLLSPQEMANASPAEVAAKLRRAPYAAQFRSTFGATALDDDATAFRRALMALEVFQETPADFAPFTSKYDAVLRGKAQLSAAEARGLRLFRDPAQGNCASCHISDIRGGKFPLFSDWALMALGVPRNPRSAANRDPQYFDLGLCGPLRTDLKTHPEYCGRFRTPSLRNVATRQVFFHNGVFTSLEEVLRFYAQRDIHPERYYPRGRDGRVRLYDDLPPQYHANVEMRPPFGRRPGERPAFDEAGIRDLLAFLRTLDDGWHAGRP